VPQRFLARTRNRNLRGMSYVVTVEFEIRPEAWERFKPIMLANARASAGDEPGCRQFDVCVAPDGAPKIFLYEVYDDEAAFKAHLETRHFKEFAAVTADMVASRKIVVFHRL
jgi:quinol monooxygenase YgiN